MTEDPKPETPATPRARDTGPLAQPLVPAPGATSDLSAALIRRGKLPPVEPPPAKPAADEQQP